MAFATPVAVGVRIDKPVPIGVPVAAAALNNPKSGMQPHLFATDGSAGAKAAAKLREWSYPPGLANEVQASIESTPLRFWIVDNSFSMNAMDGQRVVSGVPRPGVTRPPPRVITSSRTDELKDAVFHHAQLSTALGARSDFLHLNMPASRQPSGRPAAKSVTVVSGDDASGCAHAGALASTFPEAAALLEEGITPCGTTPLTEAVNAVHALIAPVAASLRAAGERAVVVIATDGLPNSKAAFLQALQLLQTRCPVFIVVRLCTSEEDVLDYWSRLDRQLERPLDVLDDVFGEASEVASYNPWLTYAPQLHAARLFGLQNKLFDMLDERELPPTAIKQMCELLLGVRLPEPELDPPAFLAALRRALVPLPLVFDPCARRMRPWIDVEAVAAELRVHATLQAYPFLRSIRGCVAFIGRS